MQEMVRSANGHKAYKSRSRRRSVLLLGVRRDAMEHLAPELRSDRVDLESAASAAAALERCQERSFELIVVRHPVPQMSIDDFFEGLRSPGSRSAEAFVLVLTDMASGEALEELSGPRTRFTNLTDFGRILAVVAKEALGVAPRAASQMMVELAIHAGDRSVSRFCQVINLSESGMLVKTSDRVRTGEQVEIAFSLPDGTPPIRAHAVVARLTRDREPGGFALAFRDLDAAASARIRQFVQARLQTS